MKWVEPVVLSRGAKINPRLVRRSLWRFGNRWSRAVALSASIEELWDRTGSRRAVRLLVFWALGSLEKSAQVSSATPKEGT